MSKNSFQKTKRANKRTNRAHKNNYALAVDTQYYVVNTVEKWRWRWICLLKRRYLTPSTILTRNPGKQSGI